MMHLWKPLFCRWTLALAGLTWLLADPLLAQSAAPSPAVRDLPGLIQQYQQRPEFSNPVPKPQLEPTPEPDIEELQPIEELPPDPHPPLQQTFPVRVIELQGASSLDKQAASELISQYEERELSFVDLRKLAEKLTELYRRKGNVTSIVYVGPQRIENGRVILTAAEGIVGEVTYEPEQWFQPRAVLPRVKLESGGVFDVNALRRSLRRINENPDLQVTATLTPGARPDETNVELHPSQERFPIHLTPFWDNLGRKSIGYQRFGVTTTHNNLTGFGDRALNSISWTRNSFGGVTQYSVPVGPHGTWLNFDHAFSNLQVGQEFADLDVRGQATIFTPSLLQEIYSNDTGKLTMDVAFDFKKIETTVEREVLALDRLRVLRAGMNWDSFDAWGRTIMRHEVGIGLDVLGATPNNPPPGRQPPGSRLQAGSQFVRYNGNITRLQRLPLDTYAILRGTAQLTPNRLVAAEQFQLGGAFTVRGYQEGRYIGDYGYVFSGEYRVPFFLIPESWNIPYTNYQLRKNIYMVGFTDFGVVNTIRPEPGLRRREYALGAGFGMRLNLTRHLAGRVDLGFPLIRYGGANQPAYDPQIHFGLDANLF